ncbi:TonB-dependent receptor plug domain-containing protein [Paludibacterium paludis]|uniref:TonB-dependent receptor n=1 Tax=Paludibacterium paludis TaxID=1225769 RepID=A0A918UB61_9NEIS|nr:TonB-dependent receptor [Paludibacterium paludis]GGY26683.1 TonB-dependent receptor [Paludibacterium paludis]
MNKHTMLLRLGAMALASLSQGTRADGTVPAEPLEKVTVTGSRIARAAKEGPTGVTVVTGKDIEQAGYRNVFDAISQQTQNTGFVQGADFGNTFTPAANAVSLRGLGPNHTLVLINGRRVADYPLPYEGSINFVNLANIPAAMIERIEILNGGASAIYGSDAIAGVINIILKKHLQGIDVNLKLGTTSRGGANDARIQISGGGQFGALSTVFSAELSQRDPLWSKDRDFMSSTTLQGAAPTVVWSRRNAKTERYIAPGGACANLAGHFEGSVAAYTGKKGTYCGSGRASPDFWTLQTKNASQNYYAGAHYALNESTDLFGDLLLGFNATENNTRGPSWTSAAANSGYFLNQNTGVYEVWTKRFSPEEIGGADRFNRRWEDTAANLSFGVRGQLPGSSWNYEAAYNASTYTSQGFVRQFLRGLDTALLGPELGQDANGISIYAPDAERFARPFTSDGFNALTGKTKSTNKAWTQALSISANGDLFALPAGNVKLAALAEAGSQGFSNTPDAQIARGVFYNSKSVAKVSGTRSRYALGAELAIPVLNSLQTTLAARYDAFKFAERSLGKLTYNAGLEYRPHTSLLVRGNYATSFRAPDMNYIFATETRGYYSSSTDYYRCKQAGQPVADCEYADVSPGYNYVQTGSKDLKPENGESFGYGLIWSPSANFDVSVDYWHIRISDLVTDLSSDTLLRDEADCRTGVKDPASALCLDTIARITRNPLTATLNPGAVREIRVNPINAASEKTGGIDVTGKWKWRTDRLGAFIWSVNYSKVLTHTYRQFATDTESNRLKSMSNRDWPDKLITSLDWSLGPAGATLTAIRYGRIPDSAGKRYIGRTWLANLSARYQFGKKASASVTVNNVFDTIKRDNSDGWPFYPVGSYTPYGRQIWVQFGYRFDS